MVDEKIQCPICGGGVRVHLNGEGFEEYAVFGDDDFIAGEREITRPDQATVDCLKDHAHEIDNETKIKAVMALVAEDRNVVIDMLSDDLE